MLALGRATGTDGPGWQVRVVPNLYPAFARQEVVVHAPTHVRSFAELDDAQVEAVAEAWRLRGLAGAEAGLGYLHALVNEGRAAGASLAHSHSQLVWLGDEPPAVAAETGDAGAARRRATTSWSRSATARSRSSTRRGGRPTSR